MNEVLDFFSGLFATGQWPARWHCGNWSNFHGWLYIISDLMIWVAYALIPIMIFQYFTGKKRVIKFTKVYLLFATFILLCGATHFLDAMMFWIPMYRFNALVRLATGIVSLATVYYLVKILPDIFKQKTNIELENEIAKREAVEKQLAAANANLEAFAYIASHDLQEPLRKIQTFTDILFSNNTENIDVAKKEMANKIVVSASRMQTMIQDILNLSTINANNSFGEVNLNDALSVAVENLEIKIKEKNAIIETTDLPRIKGNQDYFAQLFMNLIGNAIKFSKKPPVINITSIIEANKVLVFVKDNGIGMDEANINKIFLAFQRLHSKSEYEGSGIGLAICKRIVELHNGNISVESKLGEGTTFIIELPKAL
ncbi:sensor histidine kinase [Parasediminibacterium sp. JCM 36343]|uniref:sensor histidine kinase n=1 Tax=Parasediminibacterium sp. JCM 36343 TaxID=3374279 RepID=UPI00397B7E1E